MKSILVYCLAAAMLLLVIGVLARQAKADTIFSIPSSAIRTVELNDICNTKTAGIRKVSARTKHLVYLRDNTPNGNHTGKCAGQGGCEVDHRISLELGGSNELSNLMVQPYFGICNAHDKDKLENTLHLMVCSHAIPANVAQDIIYNSWIVGYKAYVNKLGCDISTGK